jgi:DNA-binding PadR family transcriptional regulator
MRERLPAITHLQFLVLGVLISGEQPGRTIRHAIAAYGIRRTGPAFYQMMARLERAGLVDGRYAQITAGDQSVTERRYRLTPAGTKVWNDTRTFYQTVGAPAFWRRWSNA